MGKTFESDGVNATRHSVSSSCNTKSQNEQARKQNVDLSILTSRLSNNQSESFLCSMVPKPPDSRLLEALIKAERLGQER